MQEEFHGDTTGGRKLLYGWGTINTNVWLPSLSELVGIDTNNYHDKRGVYYPVMQGLNISGGYHVMQQGGNQFTYFQQYNASGGGQRIWAACNQQVFWTRSPDYGQSKHVTAVLEGGNPSTYILPTVSHAVHPAAIVIDESIGMNSFKKC